MTLRHLILDRDGVLNHEAPGGGWIVSPEQWRWLPEALRALRRLRAAGVRVSVATNQSCIGRGLATRQQVDAVHRRMADECLEAGGRIDAVFVCPHAPGGGCDCRKPRPGLVRQALSAAGLAASSTVLIGDDQRDLEAGLAAGVRAVLVRTGKGARTAAAFPRRGTSEGLSRRGTNGRLPTSGVPVYDDLHSAVSALLRASVTSEARDR